MVGVMVVEVVRSGELAIMTGGKRGDIYVSPSYKICFKSLPYSTGCLVRYCTMLAPQQQNSAQGAPSNDPVPSTLRQIPTACTNSITETAKVCTRYKTRIFSAQHPKTSGATERPVMEETKSKWYERQGPEAISGSYGGRLGMTHRLLVPVVYLREALQCRATSCRPAADHPTTCILCLTPTHRHQARQNLLDAASTQRIKDPNCFWLVSATNAGERRC